MNHHVHAVKTIALKGHGHHFKAGSWVKGGKLVHHKPGFFKDHVAGTFHHLSDSALSLPSDGVAPLTFLP